MSADGRDERSQPVLGKSKKKSVMRSFFLGLILGMTILPENGIFAWGATVGDPVQGKKIFRGLCIQCHGVNGDGNGVAAPALMEKPANFTDPATWRMGDDAFFINVIKNGRKIMPGFWDTINPQQIRDVLSYEKTFLKLRE